jgi:hypothetical protein
VAVADLNADGKPDIVAINQQGSNTLTVLLGNGNGTFQRPNTYGAGSDPQSVAVADLNGDGKPDVVVANRDSGSVSVFLGNGDGTLKSQRSFYSDMIPVSVAVADLTGDGKPDLVVGHYTSGAISVLLGNGDGTFQSPQTVAAGSSPYSVAVADLNGDGSPDVVTTNFGSNTVSVLLNAGSNFLGSSGSLSQTVNQDSTTSTLTSSRNPSPHFAPVTFTAVVTANAPGSGTPTGTVSFEDGALLLATRLLIAGRATFTISALRIGTHTIRADYSGDANFLAGNSHVLRQTVQRRAAVTPIIATAAPIGPALAQWLLDVPSKVASALDGMDQVPFLAGPTVGSLPVASPIKSSASDRTTVVTATSSAALAGGKAPPRLDDGVDQWETAKVDRLFTAPWGPLE